MNRDLFDRHLRALRRDRAARIGPELFLLDRAFEECLVRLGDIARKFDKALLIGCPSPEWPKRLRHFAADVDVFDPGTCFANRANGTGIEEDRYDFGEQNYDLCVSVGVLDTVNDLPYTLSQIHRTLRPDSPFIGAIAGGNCLPALRTALMAADRVTGRVIARTHPRIEPSMLAALLGAAGFAMPVVDLDRVRLRYETLDSLVRDLRGMAATSVLAERPAALNRDVWRRAENQFKALARNGRTEESLEILHFLGWNKESRQSAN